MEPEERDRSSKSHISRTIVMESNRTVTNQNKNDRSDRQRIHRAITGAKRNEGRETLRSNSSSATINNIQRQHNVQMEAAPIQVLQFYQNASEQSQITKGHIFSIQEDESINRQDISADIT